MGDDATQLRAERDEARERLALARGLLTGLNLWAKAEMKKINDDERFHCPPADVRVNAFLALEKAAWGARMQVFKQLCDRLPPPAPSPPRPVEREENRS